MGIPRITPGLELVDDEGDEVVVLDIDQADDTVELEASDGDSYSMSPRKNPKGPPSGAYRVVRGGSFFLDPLDLRSYSRSAAWPSFQGHRMIGFRVAREP